MAPSSKGPLLIRALPSSLTVPAALKDATLAELRIPLAPDLASIDLPDALLSRIKADGLPVPTPHKTKRELDNLKQSLLEWGHNAAISPPILAPTPPDLLDAAAAAAQADALARLADLDDTAPSADLLRALRLVVLSGRARWRILEELADELDTRAKARGRKTRGQEQDEWNKEEEMRDGGLATEICVVLLHSTVFSSTLLLSHIFTTSNLVHSLAAAKFEPTLIYLVTSYAATRNAGVDSMLPELGTLTRDMYRALRSRLVTDLAFEAFGRSSGPLATLSYLSPSGLGRLFGSKYSHATPIFLLGFDSTVRFFDLVDVDLSVTSLVLFSVLSHTHHLVNPLALPPAHDFAIDQAHDYIRERGEELALALREMLQPWRATVGEVTWAWSRIKRDVGTRLYRRNSAGEPHLPEAIKLTRFDYEGLADGLERVADHLEDGEWVKDITAEDLGFVEPFILHDQIESLIPPRRPAAASAHSSEELGDYFSGEVACWIDFVVSPLIAFIFDVANAVRPAGVLEASFQMASLEDALLALYDPAAAQCGAYRPIKWRETGPWAMSPALNLYTYLYTHRYALMAAIFLVDSPSPFGTIASFAPGPLPPSLAASSGAKPTVWCAPPWKGILNILEAATVRPPTINLAEAIRRFDSGASIADAALASLTRASEKECTHGRAPARVRKTLDAVAQELSRPPPSPTPPPRTPTPSPPSPSPFPPTPVDLSPPATPSALQRKSAAQPSGAPSGKADEQPRTPARPTGLPDLAPIPSSSSQHIPSSSSFFDRVDDDTSASSSPPRMLGEITNAKRPFSRTTSSSSSTSSRAIGPSLKRVRPALAAPKPTSITVPPLGLEERDNSLSGADLASPAGTEGPQLDDSESSDDDDLADSDYAPDGKEAALAAGEEEALGEGDGDGEDDEEDKEEEEEEQFGPDIREEYEDRDNSIFRHARNRAIAGWRARSTIADLLLLQFNHFVRQPQLPLVPLPDAPESSSSTLPSLAPLASDINELDALTRWPAGRREVVLRFFRSARPLGLDDYLGFQIPIRPDIAEPILLEIHITLWDTARTDKNGGVEAREWQEGLARLGRELAARGARPGCASGAWTEMSAAAMAVEGWDGQLSERGKRRELRRAKDEEKRRK
ncbi:hypothetical protein Rhopal_001823-T1 [Rhodotorula paludigena]|uniref:Uncharacterized protein n=1 Tax=Rhodotorula paludigena TaxID=86838 RepID=A0AAV5GIF8_9BASI|nr:hypothetical protein Rhopal_001823-T1 [Rhodotorula paludigena]